MAASLAIGVLLIACGGVLLFLGLPNKAGQHRRFLRFEAALVVFPPLVMVFLAMGVAKIVDALVSAPH